MGCALRNKDGRLIERSVFHGPFQTRNVSQATKLLLQLREKLYLTTNNNRNDDVRSNAGRKSKKKSNNIRPPTSNGGPTMDDEHESYLKSLDPKDWRIQDHYAVLGLKHSRFDASDGDIKQAYRKLVLRHHPDKRPENERTHKDGDYFTCITKAYEVLGNRQSRRAYDSVDPYFDDGIPDGATYDADAFFRTFPHYFEYNARWSEISPVPLLGDERASKEEVEKFYNFWFDFHSWRDYSYEFEDTDSGNLDKFDRRWMDKQNKANRAKQKKEEMSRIRRLVDLAYASDPRIRKFKQEEKEKKAAAKKAREDEIKANKLETARLAREAEERERKCREEREAEQRKREEAVKAEQAQLKKSLKRVKKNVRDICRQNRYYADDEKDDLVKRMTDLEAVCESLSFDQLNEFYRQLSSSDGSDGKTAFATKTNEIRRKIDQERLNSLNDVVVNNSSTKEKDALKNDSSTTVNPWSTKELQVLVKAVNLFPAGTNNRWDVIANFLTQHNQEVNVVRTPNEILNKVKEMQKMRQTPNNTVNNNTNSNNNNNNNNTNRNNNDGTDVCNGTTSTPRTWTNAEQQLLERGLKTYSSSLNDRWEKIAETIPTRTKEEVIQRYKELVEAVKAKRQVQKKVAS